jgi:sulfopyruvate decarboxylase TPP-binding subunit
MRGHWGETNPWQVPMGQATEDVLRLAGTLTFGVDEADRVEAEVRAAAALAFTGDASVAVLISQRLIGAKQFAGSEPAAAGAELAAGAVGAGPAVDGGGA